MLSVEVERDSVPTAREPGSRPLRRRRHIPGPRALVGGLLVATAAVGLFAAYSGASARHLRQYVIARHPLIVGSRIHAEDLESVPLDLAGAQVESNAFTDATALVGSLVVAPVRAGELVQAGDVLSGRDSAPERQLSFAIDPARAVGGSLEVGDRVDVIATFGTGSGATTTLVGTGLRVLARSDGGSGITSSSGATEVVTLALSEGDDPLPLVQAVNSGQLLLVRSTGAGPLVQTDPYTGPFPSGPAGG